MAFIPRFLTFGRDHTFLLGPRGTGNKDGFPLVGGRLDYIDGRPVAALVYQHAKHVINVFMWPTTGDATSAERIETEHGYNVEQMMVAGMNCWMVSDLNQVELDKFAELIRAKG